MTVANGMRVRSASPPATIWTGSIPRNTDPQMLCVDPKHFPKAALASKRLRAALSGRALSYLIRMLRYALMAASTDENQLDRDWMNGKFGPEAMLRSGRPGAWLCRAAKVRNEPNLPNAAVYPNGSFSSSYRLMDQTIAVS